MKKICLFFMCISLSRLLQGMHTHHTLDTVPNELILNYMFPQQDEKNNIDYVLIKLIIMHGIGNQNNNTFRSTRERVSNLANLSMVSKKMHDKHLLGDLEIVNSNCFSGNDIFKYRTPKFTNALYNQDNDEYDLKSLWFISLAMLTKKNIPFLTGYKSLWGIKYQLTYLICSFDLNIYLVKHPFNYFVLPDNASYEKLYATFQDGEKLFAKNKDQSILYQRLQEQANHKKALLTADLYRLLRPFKTPDNLHQDILDYKAKVLTILSHGTLCANITLCFGFAYAKYLKSDEEVEYIKKFLIDTLDIDDNPYTLLDFIKNTFTDNRQKTDTIIDACKNLTLEYTDNTIQQHLGDFYTNLNIIDKNNGSTIQSDQQVIPSDLIHFECVKNDIT